MATQTAATWTSSVSRFRCQPSAGSFFLPNSTPSTSLKHLLADRSYNTIRRHADPRNDAVPVPELLDHKRGKQGQPFRKHPILPRLLEPRSVEARVSEPPDFASEPDLAFWGGSVRLGRVAPSRVEKPSLFDS